MQTPQARIRIGSCDILVVGTLLGFVPDGERVRQAFQAFHPDLLALAVPAEDLDALARLASPDKPELPETDEVDHHILTILGRYGATRVPSPDLEAAHDEATRAKLPIEAIDLDDAAHTQLYTSNVKLRHLVQAASIRKKLLSKDFADSPDAYAFALAWDAAWNKPKGFARVEAEREAHMAQRIRDLAHGHQRLLAVVPATRFGGILAKLGSAGSA